jgi:hypothetical protein
MHIAVGFFVTNNPCFECNTHRLSFLVGCLLRDLYAASCQANLIDCTWCFKYEFAALWLFENDLHAQPTRVAQKSAKAMQSLLRR